MIRRLNLANVAGRGTSNLPYIDTKALAPKVVIAHSSDEMYGADRILLQVIDALSDDVGAEVEVWLPTDVEHGRFPLCEQLTRRGIPWQHVTIPVIRRAYLRPAGVVRLMATTWKGWRRLRQSEADLVYCATSACLLVAVLARLAKVPVRVVHIQERWDGREARLLRLLARSTTCRIAISGTVAASTQLDPAPIVIVNSVDDASMTTEPRRTPDIEAPLPRYVVASRWNRWKGHGTLLRAWERAGCPGTLTVLGGPPPVGEALDVRALVDEIVSRPETVDVVGEVADAANHIAAAHALILPSDEPEPFGLVVIEAFSLSRPVLASRAGGPLEIIDEGHDGWLYELGNEHQLADLLRRLDVPTLCAAGTRARRTYEERYTPQRYRREVAQLINELLSPQ